VDIALCDSEMRPIAVWQKPYAAFPKREMEWVRLEVSPAKVPNAFYCYSICGRAIPTE